jgi:aldehyde dehydrogenase (NAD+)
MSSPPFTLPVRTAIQLRHADKLYIDGVWVAPKLGGRIEVHSPYNEQHLATVAEASEADMDLAVAAARKAFDHGPWPRLSHAQRAGYLQQLAAKLGERQAELSSAWTDQVGAVSFMAPFMVGGGIGALGYYASLAETFPFVEHHKPFDGQGAARVAHEAVGVVAAIVPWNAPFAILINKIAPALLAGCTVLMKPSPETPLEAYIIAEAAEAIGLPPGVLNLLPAHRDASDHLVRNAGIDKVSFTGSTLAGKRIASVCGERIGRCALELGGKSAAIVLPDADFDHAAKVLANTISILSGQVCATLSRVVVPKARQAAFAEAVAAEMKNIRVGNPWEPGVQMGPLAMKRQLDRVNDYLRIGVAEGARLAFGGERPAGLDTGHYLAPTLFTDVRSDMRIAQEEIFGPVLALIGYEDEADAVRIANDSPFGLFGAVFTPDNDRAYRVARQVRTGALSQNAFRLDPILPFGGFKQSGIGREGGVAGLRSYLESKTILLDGEPSAD